MSSRVGSSFFITPSPPCQVADKILLLKTGNSLGPNSIHLQLLKILAQNPLSQIINKIILVWDISRKDKVSQSYPIV